MIFNTYGNPNNPSVILMHGMCQHWKSMYDFMNKLEEKYFLIIPGMDGFYENASDFTTFEDQCRQIEEYVQENHNGKVYGYYGVSQGTLVGSELLARGNIEIEKVYFDGTYVAHQGYMSGLCSYKLFAKAKKNGGKFPKAMNIVMKLMGLSEEDMDMLNYIYWDASCESIKKNMIQNYTYHLKPEIAYTKAKIWLCCGSKEPYARKSHRMLKKYITPEAENILDGYGHGQMFYRQGDKLCDMIVTAWEGNETSSCR